MNPATGITTTMTVEVCPGDCDPTGNACLARYQRWLEAASTHAVNGVTQLLEQRARFVRSASCGDKLVIRTRTDDGRNGELLQTHVITHNDELICECTETRRSCRGDARAA